jgi:lycopene beta-cyclase
MPGLDLGWQKFVGRRYRFDRPHRRGRPMIMDAMVGQQDGYRFLYGLPFDNCGLLLEDTYYSESPALDVDRLREGLDAIADGIAPWSSDGEETGLLPVLLDGELEALWPANSPPVGRLGIRGGFFHPTTGYSLPDAVRNAAFLCGINDFSATALHSELRSRAAELWRERRFFKILNRMLFRAAKPAKRYAVLEHFYRLPEPLIARFYAARLTAFDKMRIVSGRPPVPIGRALSAIRSRSA